jgi:predicted nucleic acid-binding Zn ribbon protein
VQGTEGGITVSDQYRCDVCGERFDTQDKLREHWQATHESETHQPIGAPAR